MAGRSDYAFPSQSVTMNLIKRPGAGASYLSAFLVAVLAASGEETSEPSPTSTRVFSNEQTPSEFLVKGLEVSEDTRGSVEEEEEQQFAERTAPVRHLSWAQTTAENAVSAAIIDWRLIDCVVVLVRFGIRELRFRFKITLFEES